ncbi:MAG: ABC transporter permease, partial [Candidatus Zixiibacteriota bacterium]
VCCILITLWVQNELSYDKYHENTDQIYILCIDANMGGNQMILPISNGPAGPAMVQEFPEVLNFTRMIDNEKLLVKYDNKQYWVDKSYYADNSIFNIFTYPMIDGDPQTALSTAYSAVLTEETAYRFFGEENPIGKMVKIDDVNEYTITGIIKDIPHNSHITFNMLLSFETIYNRNRENLEEWITFNLVTYLQLKKECDYKALENKFLSFVEQHMGARLNDFGGSVRYFLLPLGNIHLYADFLDINYEGEGSIKNVYIFSCIALLILIIASFNFINISTARSASRAKEVGMRKTCGAQRSKLIVQFMGESVIICLMAMFLAIILLELVLPIFNSLAEKELAISFIKEVRYFLALTGLTIIIGILAGLYPALYLSSFKPAAVLKGSYQSGKSGFTLRRILVVLQFVLSIAIIVGTITVYNQLDYMKNTKLGYNGEQVLTIQNLDDTIIPRLGAIKSEFDNINGVVSVGMTNFIPGNSINKSPRIPEEFTKEQAQLMDVFSIDPDFIPTVGIEILAGRNFSLDLSTDSLESIIINETAAKKFGWENPIGKTIKSIDYDGSEMTFESKTVIGVVRDFHTMSMHSKIDPAYIYYSNDNKSLICVRLDSTNIPQTIGLLKNKWEEITSGRPFEYSFLDESFDKLYQKEEKLGKLTSYFGILAIIIGCLGLFGLSVHSAEQRTKEVGVRKVLGASVSGIIAMLSKEFIILVAIANIIAWPIAYYIMNKWLEGFAYRINLGVSIFICAGLFALLIAILTVGFQATKAAMSNPVTAIKHQ